MRAQTRAESEEITQIEHGDDNQSTFAYPTAVSGDKLHRVWAISVLPFL